MSDRLASIQLVRGYAALVVALMHAAIFASDRGSPLALIVKASTPAFGHAGVDLFFVISGLMVWLQVKRGTRPFPFAVRRLFRLYPIFWIALVAMIIVRFITGERGDLDRIINDPGQIFLLSPSVALPVTWTLVLELYFYTVATVLLLAGQFATAALTAWCLLQVAAIAGAQAYGFLGPSYLSPLTVEFILGILVGAVITRVRLPLPALWLAIGLALPAVCSIMLGVNSVYADPNVRLLLAGVPSALAIWAVVQMETQGSFVIPGWTVQLGDASYSIYLWHYPVLLSGAYLAYRHLDQDVVAISFIIVALMTTVLLSLMSFRWIERPVNLWAAGRFRPGSPKQAAP